MRAINSYRIKGDNYGSTFDTSLQLNFKILINYMKKK